MRMSRILLLVLFPTLVASGGHAMDTVHGMTRGGSSTSVEGDPPQVGLPPPEEPPIRYCNANKWFLGYHLDPQPERAVLCLQAFDRMETFATENSAPPVIGFLGVLFSKSPEVCSEVAKEASTFTSAARLVLGYSFWKANTEAAKEAFNAFATLEPVLEDLRGKLPPDTEPEEPGSPEDLDYMWGGFFASGEEARLDKIARSLLHRDEKLDPAKILVYGAGRWSFWSNAQRDPVVSEYCVKQAQLGQGILQEEFASLVAELEGKTPPRDMEAETMRKLEALRPPAPEKAEPTPVAPAEPSVAPSAEPSAK